MLEQANADPVIETDRASNFGLTRKGADFQRVLTIAKH
jgi:hypothetical protein